MNPEKINILLFLLVLAIVLWGILDLLRSVMR